MMEFCKTHGSSICPWDVFEEALPGSGSDLQHLDTLSGSGFSVEAGLSGLAGAASSAPETSSLIEEHHHHHPSATGSGSGAAAPGERKLKFQGREAKEKEIVDPELLRTQQQASRAAETSSDPAHGGGDLDSRTKGQHSEDDPDTAQDETQQPEEMLDIDPYYW